MVASVVFMSSVLLFALLVVDHIIIVSSTTTKTTPLVPKETPLADVGEEGVVDTGVCGDDVSETGECSVVVSDDEPITKSISSNNTDNTRCGVYLAMSTLPGTGIGMFAGRNFENGESIMGAVGDHIIPIVDINVHHSDYNFFLWDEYIWNFDAVMVPGLGEDEVEAASPGFGSAANSFMDFVNVNEGFPIFSIAGNLHRSKDPGAGAFTYYHSRLATAKEDISAGQEFFVSYTDRWFLKRKELGPIPIEGSHNAAERLFRKFRSKLMSKGVDITNWSSILEDFWKTFVLDNFWNSRTLAALPSWEDHELMSSVGLIELKRNRMVRSLDWLEEHGVCADHMYMDVSTLPQAGHGAFALRPLKKDAVILPIPLIHVPYRRILEMYELTKKHPDDEYPTPDKTKLAGHQLLLNYCLGHRESTMLLCPYGPVFNMINHNQTDANVKLQWASPERSNHHPELLEKNVPHFHGLSSSVLSMELVAIRDIQIGEEIFLDYGDEWEKAWRTHISTWEPIEGASKYVSSAQLSQISEPLRTVFEAMDDPYPGNVFLVVNEAFGDKRLRMRKTLITDEIMGQFQYVPCEILRRREGENPDEHLYAVSLKIHDKDVVLEDFPRRAFRFMDPSMTSDVFNSNVFRHDIRIPDDLFPDTWKNII